MKHIFTLAAVMALVSAAPISQEQARSEDAVERRFLNGLPLIGDFLPGGSPGKRDGVAERQLNGLPLIGDLLPGGSPGKRDQVTERQLNGLPLVGDLLPGGSSSKRDIAGDAH